MAFLRIHQIAILYAFLGNKYNYIEKMTELEETGKWRKVHEITFDRYDQLEEAVGRFSKVEAKAFAYQKL